MCEIRVVLEKQGEQELLMENVTKLAVLPRAISITSLFEGPREIPDTVIDTIDFLAGKVILRKRE